MNSKECSSSVHAKTKLYETNNKFTKHIKPQATLLFCRWCGDEEEDDLHIICWFRTNCNFWVEKV